MIRIDSNGNMANQDDYDIIMVEITNLDAKLIENPNDNEIITKIIELKKKLKDDYDIDYDELFDEDAE